MDLAALVPWLSAIALIISVGTSVTTFLTSGAKKTATTVADHERRLQSLEKEVEYLPRHEAMHKLELTLKDMQVEIVKVASSAEQWSRTSARVEAYLLEKSRG